jgi:pimeloyl-ACP methyl ester carboxylesterase
MQDADMTASERIDLGPLGFSTRMLSSGSGPTTLLLHGNPDSASEWEPLMAALGSERRCLAPDLPGFGESDEPPPAFDFSRAAHIHFVDRALEASNVRDKLILVVHDIGGIVGLAWAAQNLDRLAGVVVTNTVAFESFRWFALARAWGDDTRSGRLRARLRMWAMGLAGGRLFQRVFQRTCPELAPGDVARMTREFALSPRAKRATLRLFRQITRPNFFDGYGAMVARIAAAVPTRVVWGEPDPFIPAAYAHAFGDAVVEVVPGAGHWTPLTASAQVAAAVRAVGAS